MSFSPDSYIWSSARQNTFLRDFYGEFVPWTKCHRFPTFDTFLGLDVLSDYKNMEKLVNGFLTVFNHLWEEPKNDNGRDRSYNGVTIERRRKMMNGWRIVGCMWYVLGVLERSWGRFGWSGYLKYAAQRKIDLQKIARKSWRRKLMYKTVDRKNKSAVIDCRNGN